ncbi:MAG: BatD family protein [Gammaproteobacteria bacterium]
MKNIFPTIMALMMALVSGYPALAFGEDIVLRTSLTPEQAWLGQRVILHIDVLGKNGWAQLKKVHDVDVKGAQLLRLESQSTRLNETIAGESYTGSRYEFMLFAQRQGKITVPPIPVEVAIKSYGANTKSHSQHMSTPAVEFIAQSPPGTEAIDGIISTTEFTVTQEWGIATEKPRTGDAIKRIIRLQATDVSAMAFAPLVHKNIPGLAVYPGQPSVENSYDRGTLNGIRIETITYVFETPGKVSIPGFTLPWWDLVAEELKQNELPGMDFKVSGSPGSILKSAGQTGSWIAWVIIMLIVYLCIRYRHPVMAYWRSWKNTRTESEAMYFRRSLQALKTPDRKTILRELVRWLDKINTQSQPARLDDFFQQYASAEMQALVMELSRNLDTDSRFDTQTFRPGLIDARKRWRHERNTRHHISKILPELNPVD